MELAEYEIRLKDKFTGPLKGLESKMNGFESKVGGLQNSFGGLGGAMAAAFTATAVVAGAVALGTKIVTLGAKMEQTRVSFEAMLGSSEKASGFIKQLQQFARVTPYVTSEVLDAGKQMLSFGFSAGDVIPQLTKLGDVASGLNIPLGDMIYLYGTLKTQGKAMTRDILQFAQRGIPIYDALAKVLGVNKDQVGELVTAGKVGFDDVDKAFQVMTQSGSQFGGLMDLQSKTLSGRWSTFLGTLEEIGTVLGEKMLPFIGKVVDGFSELVDILTKLDFSSLTTTFDQVIDAYQTLSDAFKELLGLFGVGTDSVTLFQTTVQFFAGVFRSATVPLRLFADMVHVIINTVKSAVPIFTEVGNLFKNLFTGNFTGVGESAKQIKKLVDNFNTSMSNTFTNINNKEKKGWEKIFQDPKKAKRDADLMAGLAERDKMFSGLKAGGTNTNSTANSSGSDIKPIGRKSESSGVEKITAGTRNVTISINKLVENVNISKVFGKNNDSELVEAVKRALLTSVNDVNIVTQ